MPQTQQIEELVVMKVDCCVASPVSGPKGENTKKTKANGQLACMLCTCTRGNNSSYQQVAVVCVWRPRTADIVTRHCLATIFTPLSFTTLTVAVASFQMADSTCSNGWKATNIGQLAPRVWDKTRAAEAHRHLRPGVTANLRQGHRQLTVTKH